jgi:hypothetical protein
MFRTQAREGCPVHPFRLAAIAIKNPKRLRIEPARLPACPVVRLLALIGGPVGNTDYLALVN